MIINCHREHFARLCRARHVSERDAVGCIVSMADTVLLINTSHPSYPRPHGPGTELSRLLKRIGINPTPTCQCRAMSQKMDQWGCDEASKPERIDEVVAVMRAEAEARGLPFLDLAGRMLVRRAIANARRNA